MQNCVAIKCPFVWYCKNYSHDEDHTDGCETQDKIMEAAVRLAKKHRAEVKAIQEAQKKA